MSTILYIILLYFTCYVLYIYAYIYPTIQYFVNVDKPKMFEKDTEITIELVVKKLREIMAARGKKRTNRKEQIGKIYLNDFIFRNQVKIIW